MSINYPVHTIPAKEWKSLKQPMNQEHTQMWQSCHDDNPPGDLWLINLFANEHYYSGKTEPVSFFCEGCEATTAHEVPAIQGNPVYECCECYWLADKLLTDLLIGGAP